MKSNKKGGRQVRLNVVRGVWNLSVYLLSSSDEKPRKETRYFGKTTCGFFFFKISVFLFFSGFPITTR